MPSIRGHLAQKRGLGISRIVSLRVTACRLQPSKPPFRALPKNKPSSEIGSKLGVIHLPCHFDTGEHDREARLGFVCIYIYIMLI